MKQFLLLGIIVIIGVCQGKTVEHVAPHVVHRVTRQAMDNMAFTRLEALIIVQCDKNGHSDMEEKLEVTYNDMKTCIKRKPIFLTERNEYLTNFDNCTRDAIVETKKCLKPNERFLPGLFHSIASSMINFMYDDFKTMTSSHMTECILKFVRHTNQIKYIQCMQTVSQEIHGDTPGQFPESKEEFCGDFIKAASCFTKTMGIACEDTPEVHKFREDYLNALRRPCGIAEEKITVKES